MRVSTLYQNAGISLPIGFELVAKTDEYFDKKTQKMKRRSPVTKNEMARQMILQAIKNQVIFRTVLFDAWFSSVENLKFIKQDCEKEVICPIKTNRKVAVSLEDKLNGRWRAVSTLEIKANTGLEIYLEGVDFPLTLVKQVFTNEDGSEGGLYLISSDGTLNFDQITTIYQRRWNVECYHKSLKQNAGTVFGKISDANGENSNKSFFCRFVRLYQIRNAESRNQDKSFCLENQIVCQCSAISFSNFTRNESCLSLRVR